jgi:nogalaviketone/aklaviketone reductase
VRRIRAMANVNNAALRRSIVITGGGTGIGRAIARDFAEQGDHVLIVGRTKASLKTAAEGSDGIRTLVANITEAGGPEAVVDAARQAYGRIDVLVNNAATTVPQLLADTTEEATLAQFATNVMAPIHLTRCALEALAESRGVVVNISTAGALGQRTWPANGVYGASKAALDFLTRTWAVELATRGIRVVGIAPGVADTGIGVRNGMTEEQYAGFLELMADRAPAGRVGTPDEIAAWVRKLVGPDACYLTGVVLPIDGGLSLT